jgi:hypothetical protein
MYNSLKICSKARLIVTAILLGCLCSFSLAGEEWSRFRGPNGTGVSTATNLPTEFGPDKNVVLKT